MSRDDEEGRRTEETPPRAHAPTPASAVEETVQVEIGVRLKAYYDTITREAVPDRFMELLGELDGVAVGDAREAKTPHSQAPHSQASHSKAPHPENTDGDAPDGPARDEV